MKTKVSEIRVYVGTYNKYNEGSIAGAWLELDDYSSKEDFYEACQELHSDCSDNEFMFQDWEGVPNGMISECSIDSEVWEYLALDEHEQRQFEAYSNALGSNDSYEYIKEKSQDFYAGQYDNPVDIAYEALENNDVELPNWLCVDMEATWQRNLCHDYIWGDDSEGNTHYFYAH